MNGSRITSPGDVREFMMAGKATLTLVSRKTGTRFTYRVRVPDDQKASRDDPRARRVHFVSLLTGVDNESSYSYIGQVFSNSTSFSYGRKSRVGADAPGVRAFEWFARMVLSPSAPALPDALEVWHEGRCGRCGRLLTVPASIARGIGPECAGKMGAAWVQPELPVQQAQEPEREAVPYRQDFGIRRGEAYRDNVYADGRRTTVYGPAVEPSRVTTREVVSKRGEKMTITRKQYDRPFDDPLPDNMQ